MRQRRGGRRAFTLYVGAIISLGVGLLVLAAVDLPQPFVGSNARAFWVYAGCVLLCELKPVRWLRHNDGEFTASWTFSVALLLSAPLAACLAVVTFSSILADVVDRKTAAQTAFNAANQCIAMSFGAGFLALVTAGRPLMEPDGQLWPYLPLAMLAGSMVYAVNSAVTMMVLALDQQVAVWPMIRRGFTVNLSTDGMLLALAPIFVVVSERSVLLMPLLLITAWAVYDSAARAMARKHEAFHDALTDLPNRRLFDQQVEQALDEARRKGWMLAIMLVDLDGFKEINDGLGHHVGDEVLQVVAERFGGEVRSHDLVARLGGDEFAVLLHHMQDGEQAMARATELRLALEAPCIVSDFPVKIGGSFGVALFPEHGDSAEVLLQAADKAMYHAKSRRLGVWLFTGARDEQGPSRVSLLGELGQAIDLELLHLHYQPKIRLSDGSVVGAEALLRWDHPTRGSISPADFMPLAEQTDLMPKLTEFVLRSALAENARWRASGIDLEIAINGSARNLIDPRFVGVVERALDEAGVPPSALEIELTENAVMADTRRTSEALAALRAMGVRIAVDDFGTGYSSITSLRDLPVDRVKLDRSFVTSMCSKPRDLHIVRTILLLASGLDLETIAEGVESLDVLAALREFGCEMAQGHLIARPLAADDLLAWLDDRLSNDVRIQVAG